MSPILLAALVAAILVAVGLGYLYFSGKVRNRTLGALASIATIVALIILVGQVISVVSGVTASPTQSVATRFPVPSETPTLQPSDAADQTEEPVEMPGLDLSPTNTSTPTPTFEAQPPSATPVSHVFDDFDDDCLSTAKWIPFAPPAPATPTIRNNCFDLIEPKLDRHLAEFNGALRITKVENFESGLHNFWPDCPFKEIQLVISDFDLEGTSQGWVGLVTSYPGSEDNDIAIWLTGRFVEVQGEMRVQIITTRGWLGSQTIARKQVLVADVEDPQNIVLGIRFDRFSANPKVGNIDYSVAELIATGEWPTSFAIAYAVDSGTELEASFDAVMVTPLTTVSRCALPTSVP